MEAEAEDSEEGAVAEAGAAAGEAALGDQQESHQEATPSNSGAVAHTAVAHTVATAEIATVATLEALGVRHTATAPLGMGHTLEQTLEGVWGGMEGRGLAGKPWGSGWGRGLLGVHHLGDRVVQLCTGSTIGII